MGKITAIIDDKLEQEFREEVVKRLGRKKGTLSIALKQAMDKWNIKND